MITLLVLRTANCRASLARGETVVVTDQTIELY
jgi:hypothetical protein